MPFTRTFSLAVLAALSAGCPQPPPPPDPVPDPGRSDIAIDRPAGAVADGVDSVQIRVTVRDSAGAPMSGVQVQLAATGAGNTLLQPAALSDASGVATGTLSTTVPESKTVSATLPQGPIPSQPMVVFAPIVPPFNGVTGTRVIHYVTSGGVVDRPADLSGATIGAYVPDDAGGYSYYPGTGVDAGTFRIPDVPAGAYVLRFGADYIATAARAVDLSEPNRGRPDAVKADAGTSLHLQLTGMSPWTSQWLGGPFAFGNLHLTAPDAAIRISALEHYADDGGLPSEGATALDLIRDYAFTNATRNLVDAAKGDRAYVLEYTIHDAGSYTRSDGGSGRDSYKSIDSAYGPFPLTVADGQVTDISGTLSPAPRHQLPVLWQLDPSTPGSFTSYRTGVNPNASIYEHFLTTAVWQVQQGLYGFVDDPVLGVFSGSSPLQTNRTLVVEYGDPFPPSWARTALAHTDFLVPLPAMGPGFSVTGTILVEDLLQSFPTAPLRPQVSPVQGPQVEGASFFSDHTLATATPLIRWAPPAVGVPTHYQVRITELRPTATLEVANIQTTDTQIVVPPGIFQSGRRYNIVVTALVEPGHSVETAPLLFSWPFHSADAVGGVLTMP